MNVGDLVMWHSDNAQDIGIVTKFNTFGNRVWICWANNKGNGWFDENHPCIGVVR